MLPSNEMHEKLTEHKAIQEMLDTEFSYNKALARLLAAQELMPEHELFTQLKIFLPQLKTISEKLLENVSKSLHEGNSVTESNQLKMQRIQLLKAFFTLYQNYAKWYEAYAKELAINPSQFTELDKYLSTSHASKLGLSDYLIQPFQRGPRYFMLVNAAIDYNHKLPNEDLTKLSDENIADLLKAKEIIQEYMLAANSSMSKKQVVKEYQFGDYTRAALGFLSDYYQESKTPEVPSSSVKSQNHTKPQPETQEGYKFGNLSRSLWASIWNKPALTEEEIKVNVQEEATSSVLPISKGETSDDDDGLDGFTVIPN
ncbi:RhoGEF domain-containing protein [Legionella cardiaca]|uniref:DH domain-containing protein n=1 Tax=Legionella cardiaca TaxID=1071983 RepID=A0ABY8AYN8_9GAMM|nr:RhoGEF domain-containing protein [Legionella cardiaca]WED44586.1 hypothetical protein PXX05_07300 [Legionella cardiaca]